MISKNSFNYRDSQEVGATRGDPTTKTRSLESRGLAVYVFCPCLVQES